MTTKNSPHTHDTTRQYHRVGTVLAAQWVGFWILKAIFWTVARGRRHLPTDLAIPPGGLVMVSNHYHYYDAFMLIGALPWRVFRQIQPVYCMIGTGYMGHPVAGRLGKLVGTFPSHDGLGFPTYGLSFAHQVLDAGHSVFITPEGRRTQGGRLPAKPGVAKLAARDDVTVWPMHVSWKKRWIGWELTVRYDTPRPMTHHTAEEILDAAYALAA